MKRTLFFTSLSLFGLVLMACGGGDGPSEGDPSHEHQWGNPTYQWSSDYLSCTAQRVCELVASHVEKETVSSVVTDQKSPTETEDGFKEYTATFTNEAFETQVHVEVIYATGHEHTYSDSWSYDETYHWHAANCGHDVIKDKAAHSFQTSHGEDGATVYTCECGYSYEVGGTPKMLEYKDNMSIPFVLNNIFKEVLSNDNFTLERTRTFENVSVPAGAVQNIGEAPNKADLIAAVEDKYKSGEMSEEQYLNALAQIEQMFQQLGQKFNMNVNGTFKAYIKINGRESELGRVFNGEVTAQLSDVLQAYGKESWAAFNEDASTLNRFVDDIRTGFSQSESASNMNSFEIEVPTLDGEKVVILKNELLTISEFYDSDLGQFYYKGESVPNGYLYVAPTGQYFDQLSCLYSAVELYRYFAYDLTASQIRYDETTHSYIRDFWGSGGAATLYQMGDLFPVVIDNDSQLVSMGGYTVKDVGTTVISTSKTVPECAHLHGTTLAWYDKNFHADYCNLCGRRVSRHSHDCDNEHDYCVTCNSFKNPRAFEAYEADYVDQVTGLYGVEINKDTNKKYGSYTAYSTSAMPITGKDGKEYLYFSIAPTNGDAYDYWVVASTHGEGAEDAYLQDNSCVYLDELLVYRQQVNATYLKLSADLVPDEYQNRINPDNYYNVTKEIISSPEVFDTVYTRPQSYHKDITLSSYRILDIQQALAEIPAVYSRVESYTMYYGQLDHTEQYRFLVSTCDRCGELVFACIAAPDTSYLFNMNVVYDFNAHQTDKRVKVEYEWGENYESCTAVLLLGDASSETATVISSEEAVVTNDTENHIITATFTKPEFMTQEYMYYGE